jgi:hypothetical protein
VFALFGARRLVVKLLVVIIVAGAFQRVIALTSDQFNVDSKADLVRTTDYVSHTASRGGLVQGGSSQSVTRFQDVWGMVKFVPFGAFTALFRPLPGEVLHPFGLLAGFENLGLLALLLRAVRRARWREVMQPLIMWVAAVVLLWSVVYGFASTQNLGTAVRWKLQILPLFVGLLCYVGRRRF